MAGFQLRHEVWGVYQGNCFGLGFWHPLSDMPEQGFCRFPSLSEAEEYRDFLTGKCAHPDSGDMCSEPVEEDFLVAEPFDEEAHEEALAEG
jgi:hypothetical protein